MAVTGCTVSLKSGREAKLIDWPTSCGVRPVCRRLWDGKGLLSIVLDYSEEFLPNEIGTGVQKRRADNARLTL